MASTTTKAIADASGSPSYRGQILHRLPLDLPALSDSGTTISIRRAAD
jgi:hypothetical protein